MKGVGAPSIIAGFFSTSREFENYEKAINSKRGLKMRTLRLVDIQVDLNPKYYNSNMNFLKSIMQPTFYDVYHHIPLRNALFNFIDKKALLYSYHKIDWRTPPFKMSTKFPMGCSGLTPLFLAHRYSGSQYYGKADDKKIENMKIFKTHGYKPCLVLQVGLHSHKWRKTPKGLKKVGKHYEI